MQRRIISITGLVQGVGFRPFVFHLANELRLTGSVQNLAGKVRIEAQGEPAALDALIRRLASQAPPLARIHQLDWHGANCRPDQAFVIVPSSNCHTIDAEVFVSPDTAPCAACLRELFDRGDRRFAYPFLNCTHCGPRLTIMQRAPYDRENTSLASFAMCKSCRQEYEDPSDRRFHAQPIACPACGPTLQLLDSSGTRVDSPNPMEDFRNTLLAGKIGAIKGIGGYHLICLATDAHAVATLRRRKHRYDKPFAVLVPDADSASQICEMNRVERELLESPRRPIVLLRKRTNGAGIALAVSPHNSWLGLMLPYSPLHELFVKDCPGQGWVLTSGNSSDEPIAYQDLDARDRLSGIADCFLTHNRAIQVRCDDSVTAVIDGRESPIRRSRGYAPFPIQLAESCRYPMLAVGGQLKNTFAIARGQTAHLSHHLGDLDHLSAYQAFERDIDLYENLFDVSPQCLVHDLHPDYVSTAYAVARAQRQQLSTFAVQHHHAHLASCMADNGLEGRVLGVVFDGSGFGTDGTVWGGEFLAGGFQDCQRVAHLRNVRMPGGDRAVREPWRMAISHLQDAECDIDDWQSSIAMTSLSDLGKRDQLPPSGVPTTQAIRVVRHMLDRGLNSPWTSSAGRLFDAVAALIGLRFGSTFEGQSAMHLEALAMETQDDCDLLDWTCNPVGDSLACAAAVDTRPLIRQIVRDVRAGIAPTIVARRFHNTLATIIACTCHQISQSTGLRRVVLSGGVFMNRLLSVQTAEKLVACGLSVYQHHQVPANDGGLALGQLAIAARNLQHKDHDVAPEPT